ncbi:MAG: chromate transporter [Treponema sp.]|nr:chromate transporter [Treponema sp.]
MVKDLLNLYFVFFKIGAVTFGGGYAMLPILERELVDKRNWATSDDLMDYYAISQVTPGVIAVNVSTFVGFRRRKIIGGIFATMGVVTPSIIIITLISLFISNFESIVWVQKALKGINVAVTALLTYAVFNFARKSIKKWWGIIFYAASFCAIFFLKIPSVAVIVASAIAGVLIAYFSGNLKKVDEVQE